MSNFLYWILYGVMLFSFLILSLTTMPTLREKAIGILITMVNALLFLPKG